MSLGLGVNISKVGFMPYLKPYVQYLSFTQGSGADTPPLKAVEHGVQVETDFSRIRSVPSLLCTCDAYSGSALLSSGKLYTIIPE